MRLQFSGGVKFGLAAGMNTLFYIYSRYWNHRGRSALSFPLIFYGTCIFLSLKGRFTTSRREHTACSLCIFLFYLCKFWDFCCIPTQYGWVDLHLWCSKHKTITERPNSSRASYRSLSLKGVLDKISILLIKIYMIYIYKKDTYKSQKRRQSQHCRETHLTLQRKEHVFRNVCSILSVLSRLLSIE